MPEPEPTEEEAQEFWDNLMSDPDEEITTGVRAKVVADSYSPRGHRVTTIEATGHRFVLAEINTHRAFSRNSASSRARPIKKVLAEIQRGDIAYPVEFGTNQKGMTAGPPLVGETLEHAQNIWRFAAKDAVISAKVLMDLGVHKQVVNRLLEPFLYQTMIITATEWEGFFDQRCHPDAQPEIRTLAEAIKIARGSNFPELVREGEWHLPYIQEDERDAFPSADLAKISAARCARVSYLTHDGVRDPQEDLNLYVRLAEATPPHLSPLEHPCTPANAANVGNLVGWHQLRHVLEAANSL